MNKLRILLQSLLFSSAFGSTLYAQMPRPIPKLSPKFLLIPASPHLSQKSNAKLKSDSLFLVVQIELPPKWHINSDMPPDSFLVATKLEAEAKGLAFGQARFPVPDRVFSPAMGDTLPLFSGVFEIRLPAQWLAGLTAPNTPHTRVTLHYQACNDSMCLPPKDVTAELVAGVVTRPK